MPGEEGKLGGGQGVSQRGPGRDGGSLGSQEAVGTERNEGG